MSENKKSIQKFYLPSCQKCNGLLNISINPLNFSISYVCEKDNKHCNKDIFFKTFERFYLKEKEIYKCSKCDLNLDNCELYKCETCKLIYCGKCCIEDIRDNNHKMIFENNNRKCKSHNLNFNYYCLNCKENICAFCIKDNNFHFTHKKINYIDISPSNQDIKSLINKIQEKIKNNNNIMEKIDVWKKEINKKAEELKQNLKDEISFLSKVIFNYNYSFLNFSEFIIYC
jgi:hypothetical protein